MEQYSLTYDFGSGSLKAALVNAQHRIAASCNLAYSTIFPQKGWAVQRPDELWVCMQQATRQLMETTQALPSQVRGIAISHTGSNFIFLDKNGVPLCDCVLWMDGRAVVQAAQLNQALGEQRYTGKNVIAKLRWFMENEPELIARAEKMVDLQGYLFFLMTGTVAVGMMRRSPSAESRGGCCQNVSFARRSWLPRFCRKQPRCSACRPEHRFSAAAAITRPPSSAQPVSTPAMPISISAPLHGWPSPPSTMRTT